MRLRNWWSSLRNGLRRHFDRTLETSPMAWPALPPPTNPPGHGTPDGGTLDGGTVVDVTMINGTLTEASIADISTADGTVIALPPPLPAAESTGETAPATTRIKATPTRPRTSGTRATGPRATGPRIVAARPAPGVTGPAITTTPIRITLALQGGGAHGAFTWGVLDRLMEEPDLVIVGVSGASAGAMNGAMLIQGLGRGGREAAREDLNSLWQQVSRSGPSLPMPGAWVDVFRRWVTPYDIQPSDYHPLRPLLTGLVNVDAIRESGIRFFVSACNVATGALRLFDESEVDVDHLLASACLPHLFQAVRIGDADYWDGGYLANPALFPLLNACPDADMVLVSVNPFACPELPRTPDAINDRLSQITFNAALRRELADLDAGRLAVPPGIRRHHIQADDALRLLSAHSKLTADWKFLTFLRDLGRQTADDWLHSHRAQLGLRGTMVPSPDVAPVIAA